MTPAPMLTVEEYLRTPESTRPQELAYGVWRVADAPAPRHQSAVFALGLALNEFVRGDRLGRIYLAPVDVVLDRERHLVVQPDLVFVASARLDIVRDRIWGPPDLAIEVLSPRPRIGDVDERLRWFAEYGVRECWLVHQNHCRLEMLEFAGGTVSSRRTYLANAPIQSRVLPGWHRTLASVLIDFEE